jgi:hypothetical protein
MKFSFHLKCLSVLKVIEMIKCEREKIEVETEGFSRFAAVVLWLSIV